MKLKKHIAFLLIAAILFNVFPLNVFAAYPYGGIYGRGTYADPVDYIKVYNNELRYNNGISEPTAMFSILDPNKNTLITSSDTAQTLSLFLGDKVTFKDLSTPGSGDNLTKYDFQITHRGALVAQYSTRADVEKVEGFTFNDVGEYNIYLNVMDDTPKEKTDYWGNWSYNGSHKAIGVNPGPTSGSDDDFYGYWYFVEIKVIVSPHTLTETHYDIDTGMELSKTVYNSITSSEYTTYAKTPQQLPGYTYMGSKAGYTWSEAESSIMSASTVTSRKAKYGYINYAENKGSNNAFHWYYYRKLPGLYAAFVIKYSGIDYTDKDLIVQNLPITVNLQDLSVGDKITNWLWEYKTPDMPSFEIFSNIQNPTKELDAEKTYTFRLTVQSAAEQKSIEHYVAVKRGTPVITGEPPTAIITGPSERMAGENITFSGGSSFDPDGTIVSYTWSVPGANVVTNGGKTIKVWYPEPGEYDLFLTVVDNDGMTGECMANIKIIPPIPTAAIDISGKLKENRKVAVSAENS
ncbi:MAG: PKD domain-containing protein, partial [Caulobacteraceae bacterium]